MRISLGILWSSAIAAVLTLAALGNDSLPAEQAWRQEYIELTGQIACAGSVRAPRERLKAETLDRQALILPEDRDPLDIVIRRTTALLDHFAQRQAVAPDAVAGFRDELKKIQAAGETGDRSVLFLEACALRRRVAFANPLLDFDRVVCMLEDPGNGRIVEQARAVRGHRNGGGPVLLRNIKGQPEVISLLTGVCVSNGQWKGKELTGKFSGLELTCDGSNLLFSATTGAQVWHVFRFNIDTMQLVQLTDGPDDDFDPCELPSGRIVFVSTRRGGIGRCKLMPQSLTYTLYSMEPDGTDIVCISFHETNEWQPSVNHAGKIVYTRWDYVDRHWGTAHHFWESFPDGRDPRNYHGNYPLPLSAMTPGLQPERYGLKGLPNGRFFRPDAEVSFRAVPGSHKYTATAVGHHQGFSGSLVLLDTRIPDDGQMSQLKRITPEYPFPEVEPRGLHAYGTPWPLSEDFYLCNFNSGLYLLDRFGNREAIYEPGEGPYRVRDPFPLRSRTKPSVLPVMTWQGKRAGQPDHYRATISVMNVYAADAAAELPAGITAKWMRIVQVIPQLQDNWFNNESVSQISFASDSIGRVPLGIVPVEDDGSVYCEAPVGKALYFQLLDADGMAVHSMRSVTYVHPGEQLSCIGCHEDKWRPATTSGQPKAMQRPSSKLQPEVTGGALPFNYIQLVKKPVFDKKCVACHQQNGKAPDMSYRSLARHDLVFSYPGEQGLGLLGVGGSRTTPGKFGAHASGIMKALAKPQHKDVRLTDDERRRLTLWLDLNANEIGWIGRDREQIRTQKNGAALWPPIDMDKENPTGVERDRPVP